MKFSRKQKGEIPRRRRAETQDQESVAMSSQFRRNRTLSGVERYDTVTGGSTRAKVHHLTNQRRKVGGLLVLVIGGALLIGLLITQFSARVVVTGSAKPLVSTVDHTAYEKVINDYLGIHPAGRLRFLLNESELSEYASAVAPEIAKITQTGSQNVVDTHFTITFRQPIAGWQINGKQFYVDDKGTVFQKNYYEPPTVQIVDESGVSPEQGSTVASARLLSFVGRVVALSKDAGFEVEKVILPIGTTRQVEVTVKGQGSIIKLSIDRGAGEQVEDMARSIVYLSSKGIVPGYIDVRVAGRAVYQ